MRRRPKDGQAGVPPVPLPPRNGHPAAPPPPTQPVAPPPTTQPDQPVVIRTDSLNELIIIAACLVDWEEGRKLATQCTSDYFQIPQHQVIWDGLRAMHAQGMGWDPETLRQVTGGKADVDYVCKLIETRPEVPPNLPHHVGVLVWDRARAEAARGPLPELQRALEDPGTAPERVAALARQAADTLEQGARRDTTRLWSDLATHYEALGAERQWRVDGAIEGSPITVLIGPEKSHKSWLLMDLTVAVATGGSWAGRFPARVVGTPVYCDGEYGPAEFTRRVARLARGAGREPVEVLGKVRHYDAAALRLVPGNPAFGQLLAAVRSDPPALIVLDPWRNLLAGNENDSDVTIAALSCVAQLRDAAGCPVVIAHHVNKAGTYSGSRALMGRADLIIEGEDSEQPWYAARGRTLRRGDAIGTRFTVTVEHTDDLDDTIAATRIGSRAEGETNAQHATSKGAVRVLRVLETAPDGLTKTGVRTSLRMGGAEVSRALDELHEAARVVCVKGRWRLSTSEAFAAMKEGAEP